MKQELKNFKRSVDTMILKILSGLYCLVKFLSSSLTRTSCLTLFDKLSISSYTIFFVLKPVLIFALILRI